MSFEAQILRCGTVGSSPCVAWQVRWFYICLRIHLYSKQEAACEAAAGRVLAVDGMLFSLQILRSDSLHQLVDELLLCLDVQILLVRFG